MNITRIDSERKVIICDTAFAVKIPPANQSVSNLKQNKPTNMTTQQSSHPTNVERPSQSEAANPTNWYGYYPIHATHNEPSHFHHQPSNNIYQHIHQQYNDVVYTTNYPAPYARFLSPYQTVYQQSDFFYQPQFNDENQTRTAYVANDHTAGYQYSISTKRGFKGEQQDDDDRSSKRVNLTASVEISPVYSHSDYTKVELRQNDDDSLTSNGENYPSSSSDPLHQSANSSSSFAMSSSIVSSS